MEIFFLIAITICLATLLKSTFLYLKPKKTNNLPPGPPSFPIITTFLWLRKSLLEIETSLRSLHEKLGPMVTLPGPLSTPFISITNHDIAYQALVRNGSVFADRPRSIFSVTISNQTNISSARYGRGWSLLLSNLTQMVHPSSHVVYSHARKLALDIILTPIKTCMAEGEYIKVKDHIRFGIFHLLVVMCFGSELNESQVQEMEVVQGQFFQSSYRFRFLDAWPWLSRTILRHFCKELFDLRKKREEWLTPLIRTYGSRKNYDSMTSYLRKLVTFEVQDESNRKLNESELVSLCSEFLNAGTDTTVTLLEWIMANLVKYPDIQHKLFNEITQVIGEKAMEVDEEALPKIDYLKAVVLEGLRRHPPAHFTLPHSVTKQVQLGGFTLPKNSVINFSIAEMGLDRKVWEDPLKFRPERFVASNGEFDVACKREIKMMPFGAGRRICPAYGLAILHLQYFVANLVWNFEWTAIDGEEIDFCEKQEITVAMKYPLHAQVTPRI